MSSIARLFKELFCICKNGVIPNLKFVSALTNAHKAARIYHHNAELAAWAPTAGGTVRMCAKHWRDIAMDEDKLDKCFRKAWGLQTKNRLGHFPRL